jgi:hypothetical protein
MVIILDLKYGLSWRACLQQFHRLAPAFLDFSNVLSAALLEFDGARTSNFRDQNDGLKYN